MQNKILKISLIFLFSLLFLQADYVLAGACGPAATVTSYNGSVYLKTCNQRAWGSMTAVCPNPGFPSPGCALKLCENQQESYDAQDNITVTKSGINGNLLDTLSWSCGGTPCSVPYRTDYTACNAAPLVVAVNGACGSANGQSFTAAPDNDLCAAGTIGSISETGSNSWMWTCNGSNGGTNTACYAYQKINGVCGPAAKVYASTENTFVGAFCSAGTANPAAPAFPTAGSSVSWTCLGINGGADATCSASRTVEIINGACGTANNKTYLFTDNSYGSYTQCANGVANSTAFPAPGQTISWVCAGVNGGTSFTCSASRANEIVNGACGSANGQSFASAPITNLCSKGTASTITYSGSSSWLWTCSGSSGGVNVGCYAYQKTNGVCGSAAKIYASTENTFVGAFCSAGTANPAAPVFPTAGNSVSWICNGLNGGANSNCIASRIAPEQPKVNGACGSAAKVYASTENTFVGAFCSAGTANPAAPAFPTAGSSVSWTCNGLNGGTVSPTCTASRNNPQQIINGECGSANGQSFASAPTTNLCSKGTASAITNTNSNSWLWTCSGSNGGTAVACYAYQKTKPIPCGHYGDFDGNGVISTNDIWQGFLFLNQTSQPLNIADVDNNGQFSFGDLITINDYLKGAISTFPACMAVNGVCGSAATTYKATDTAFVGAFCSAGTANPAAPAFPAQGISTLWTCSGINGGTSASCSALRAAPEQPKINGACGTANGVAFAHTETNYGSYTQCASGTASNTAFPAAGSSVSWTCSGTNGGTVSPTCTASRNPVPVIVVNGKCGTANGQSFYSAPATGLCAEGTAGTITYSGSSSWLWTCAGANGGTNVGCYAYQKVNGVCGTANGKEFVHSDTNYGSYTQCAYGSPSNTAFPAAGSSVSWTCSGINGGNSSGTCMASRDNPPAQIIDGECGSAYGQSFTTAPTTGLCDAGTPSAVTGTGPWTWSCEGMGKGSTSAWCSANWTPE